MKGRHKVIVQNNRLHYEFEVKRNITIILGDSATGKTTLIDMLRQNMDLGPDSGVDVICDVPCAVLEGRNWQAILGTYSQTIVFIDEGNAFVGTEEFASAVKASDNYFVLITRENLYNLPYSVGRFMACIHRGSIRTPGRCIRNCIGFIRSQSIIFGSRINCWWRIPTLAMNSLRLWARKNSLLA